MSVQRVGASALFSLRSRSSALAGSSSPSRKFSQCLFRLTSQTSIRFPATRTLATASAYTPHDLHPQTPPPRNVGVPDTSISTSPSDVQTASLQQPHPPERSTEKPNVSITEGEAQKSKPLQTTTTTDTAPSPPKRRSKLRPRKAAMSLTPAAVSQLRDLLDQPTPQLIRVGVKNRGCSGLAYHLEYVDAQGTFDEAVDQDGVKVLIDSKALFSIIGSEMDWVEDKLSARFVFRNPNITEQCGCGESFSIS